MSVRPRCAKRVALLAILAPVLLVQGVYRVEVRAGGFETERRDIYVDGKDTVRRIGLSLSQPLDGGQEARLTVSVRRGGNPVAGAALRLISMYSDIDLGGMTDKSGVASFPIPTPGVYMAGVADGANGVSQMIRLVGLSELVVEIP